MLRVRLICENILHADNLSVWVITLNENENLSAKIEAHTWGTLHKEVIGLSFLSFAHCTIKKICQYASIGIFLLMHIEQNQFA